MNDTNTVNFLIILGGGLENCELNQQTKLRYEKALTIQKKCNHIICSSGFTYKKNHLPSTISEAEAGKRYLVQQGIPAEKIILEDLSKDTFSNAFYCRKIIDKMGSEFKDTKIKNIIVITSAFHMKRSAFVFDLVFPKGKYNLRYVKSRNGIDPLSLKNRTIHEKLVLHFFMKHLSSTYGVIAGDMGSIERYLNNHNLATSGKMDLHQQTLTAEIKKRMDKRGKLYY
jgi:hypothetical protein